MSLEKCECISHWWLQCISPIHRRAVTAMHSSPMQLSIIDADDQGHFLLKSFWWIFAPAKMLLPLWGNVWNSRFCLNFILCTSYSFNFILFEHFERRTEALENQLEMDCIRYVNCIEGLGGWTYQLLKWTIWNGQLQKKANSILNSVFQLHFQLQFRDSIWPKRFLEDDFWAIKFQIILEDNWSNRSAQQVACCLQRIQGLEISKTTPMAFYRV